MQNFLQFCHIFGPVPKLAGFSQDPSSDARFPTFSTFLALLHQKMSLGFRRIFRLLMQISTIPQLWPHCTQELLGFQDFPLLMQIFTNVPHFWACCTKNLSTFPGFSSSDATFPTCAYKHTHTHAHTHTMVPAEPVKFYRNSDVKQFLSESYFLHIQK